jgi:Protein of unknown function (DUF4435)
LYMVRGLPLEEDVQRMKDEVVLLRLEKVVLVEGMNDKKFWKLVFDTADVGKYEIYTSVNHPTFNTTGKSTLLKYYASYVQRDFVLCVDSDYDYLLEKPELIRAFIFQTYCYSVENHWCYVDGLAEIVKKGTNTEGGNFDFTKFMNAYSKVIYPYLLVSLFSKKQDDGFLPPENLGKNAGFNKITKPNSDLAILRENLTLQFSNLQNAYSQDSAFKNFKKRLSVLGLNKENAYQFVRGHDILGKVTLPLMKYASGSLTNKRYKSLKTNEEKAAYQQHLKANSFENAVENNPKMAVSYFFQKIVQDIHTALT